MNNIFLFIAVFLLVLGMYPFAKRRSLLTVLFMVTNSGLALWNLCYYLQQESLYFVDVNLVSQIQLASGLLFINGFFYMSGLYPAHTGHIRHSPNLLVFALFAWGIFGTEFVSRAELENGTLVFIDGPGYALYALYGSGLVLLSLRNLYQTYQRKEQHRSSILLVSAGIATFTLITVTFAFLLPMMGNFSLLGFSTLSAIFPLTLFAYALTKHDFLDLAIIINKTTAWFITLLIVICSFSFVWLSTVGNNHLLGLASTLVLGVFWSVFAVPMQQFLLTTAKRKFIRGWYDTEEVFNQLSEKVSAQKSRPAIFQTIEKVLDSVLEVENTAVVVAVRDADEHLTHYQLISGAAPRRERTIAVDHDLVAASTPEQPLRFLEDCEESTQALLLGEAFKPDRRCLLLSFHSPEALEGLVILGERSNQAGYANQDLGFFRRLVNYMSAIFYRLTPMEKLERLYFENVQRLHEAQIQLIRAQKIESIVHATRQCHHEIRTPLNIIRMGLRRVKDLEGLKVFQQLADEEISHALEIVDETLLISGVEKGPTERETVFNLNDSIRRSLKLVQEDRYRVHAVLDQVVPVKGVSSDLQVVFANLIHNAADAMPEGGAISIQSTIADNEVVVEFSDTGKGIPEDQRERVWEPYYSGQATLVGNSTAGRGWGLTIVNRIITEHRGTINFSSVVGEGTTFVIKLPLAVG